MRRYLFLILLILNMAYAVIGQQSTLPNLHVKTFSQDKNGIMWILTARGLCRYNGYEYTLINKNSDSYLKLPSDLIYDILTDSKGRLWISAFDGICLYDRDRNPQIEQIAPHQVCKFIESSKFIISRNDNSIVAIDKDKIEVAFTSDTKDYHTSGLFLTTNNRLYGISADGRFIYEYGDDFSLIKRTELPFGIEFSSSINLSDGAVLLGHSSGLIRFDPRTGEVQVCNDQDNVLKTLQVSAIKEIGEGAILLGSINKGLWEYDLASARLTHSKYNAELNSCYITSIFEDDQNNIWIGTFDNGYTTNYSQKVDFDTDSKLQKLCQGKFVTSLAEDHQNNIWIGTRSNGLIWYNPQTGAIKEYNSSNSSIFRDVNSNFVQSVYSDTNGVLWASVFRTLLKCTVSDGELTLERSYNNTGGVVSMYEDSKGRLWVGTESNGLIIYDKESVVHPIHNTNVTSIVRMANGEMAFSIFGRGIFVCSEDDLMPSLISENELFRATTAKAIFLTRIGSELWVGTYDDGMTSLDLKTSEVRHFTSHNGLTCNDVLSITPDTNNSLWISTSFGLVKYDVKNDHFRRFYTHDGIEGNQFHEKCRLLTENRLLYFGGNHGITQLDTKTIIDKSKDVNVVLEDLKLFYESVTPVVGSKLLSSSIDKTKSVEFSYDQNVFSIDYAGVNYKSSIHTNYAYRLVGFDTDWNYVGEYRRASYSNLPSGKYRFEVKAQNSDGYWSGSVTSLDVIVRRPPWLSAIAIIIYIVIFALLVVVAVVIYNKFQYKKRMLWLAESQRDKEKQMSKLKANFFMNISHELRTPVSMIYAPLSELMSEETSPQEKPMLLNLIKYNTQRLLLLLDQLLDFNKIENDTYQVIKESNDCIAICNNIVQNFAYFAQEKDISIKIKSQHESLIVDIDTDKIIKILSNLTSNALKYTSEQGEITIVVDIADHCDEDFPEIDSRSLVICVEDTGIGIPLEEQSAVFERHKRVCAESNLNITGHGIGLHYVKRLIEVLGGAIVVKPNNPKGTIFKFYIPIESAPDDHEMIDGSSNCLKQEGEERIILVVEDNHEIIEFIKVILSKYYTVHTAYNGDDGYKKVVDIMPDVVLSDILMPGMSGIELCREVKNNPIVCHIPIILLTAKTTTDDQIEGYKAGANVYLNKPFSPQLLKTVISNIFADQTKKQGLITDKISSENLAKEELKLSDYDKKTLNNLYTFIDSNISNTDLNVEVFGLELGFSRSSFYRKMSALTGQTPISFLRRYRLNRSKELLETSNYTISEVSDMTGFISASHFSTCFKKQYGVSPREIKH